MSGNVWVGMYACWYACILRIYIWKLLMKLRLQDRHSRHPCSLSRWEMSMYASMNVCVKYGSYMLFRRIQCMYVCIYGMYSCQKMPVLVERSIYAHIYEHGVCIVYIISCMITYAPIYLQEQTKRVDQNISHMLRNVCMCLVCMHSCMYKCILSHMHTFTLHI
jgi:hypothetical protein